MMQKILPVVAAATCCFAAFVPHFESNAGGARPEAVPQGGEPQGGEPQGGSAPQGGGAADMAAMMAKAKKLTAPGKHHKQLEKFLGKWKTTTRLFMGGQEVPQPDGTAEGRWAMEGRWLLLETKGSLFGSKYHGLAWTGYDNFKQSYVVTAVSSMDTAMIRSEGDMDPGGKVMLLYGTLDEYLTGEHDKMVKTVWRFVDDDHLTMEVHDLPIGEKNTKVFEVRYERVE